MASIESQQPLQGQSVTLAGGTLREASLVGKLILRCDNTDAAVEAFLLQHGLVLPVEANTHNTSEKGGLFWLGPDEWLLRSSTDPSSSEWSDTVGALNSAASGRSDLDIALVDVSDYYTVLQLEGPHSSAILARSCPFDLHTLMSSELNSSEVKRCAQTRIGNAAALLDTYLLAGNSSSSVMAESNDTCWNIQVRWSYADYLWKLLLRSAISF